MDKSRARSLCLGVFHPAIGTSDSKAATSQPSHHCHSPVRELQMDTHVCSLSCLPSPLPTPPHPKLTSTCPIGADMADEGMGLPQPQKACARSAPFEATALAVSRVPNCSRHRIQNWLPTLTDNALKRTWKEEPRTKSQTTRNQSHSCPRLPIDRQRMLQTNGKPEGGGPDSKGPLASLVRKGPSLARE